MRRRPNGRARATESAPTAPEGSNKAIVLDLLRRERGATLVEIAKATGWQNHSMRGFVRGTTTKKMGLTVDNTKPANGADHTYRVAN